MTHFQRTLAVSLACLLGCATLAHAQDWPQWRGPNRDNKIVGFTEPAKWPKELTKKWKVTVGIGEASPVLVGDKVYVFGRQEGDEVTLCLDAATGETVWKDKYAAAAVTGPASGYPGPRSTPAVADGKVCTLGVQGVVSCLDAKNGNILWRKETKQKPMFYTATSPIIVDGKLIIFLGKLTAYDLASGDVKWTWSGADTPYGSPVITAVDGVKMIVTPAMGALAGVNLADGKGLWQTKLGGGYQSNYSTPLTDGAMVYYTMAGGKKGGAGGTFALKIEKGEDGFKAGEVWRKTTSAGGYHTPLLHEGRIYGVSSAGNGFFCLDAKTGDSLWTDSTKRGQCGCIVDGGSVLLALTSDKDLVAFRPSGKEYNQVAKYRVADSETWCVPIIAGNRVFVKDKGGSLTLWTID
jgi:outer membrane protein assembly factor BamB